MTPGDFTSLSLLNTPLSSPGSLGQPPSALCPAAPPPQCPHRPCPGLPGLSGMAGDQPQAPVGGTGCPPGLQLKSGARLHPPPHPKLPPEEAGFGGTCGGGVALAWPPGMALSTPPTCHPLCVPSVQASCQRALDAARPGLRRPPGPVCESPGAGSPAHQQLHTQPLAKLTPSETGSTCVAAMAGGGGGAPFWP